MKKILKQDSNSRQRQDIVPVSNLKARKTKHLLLFPIHLVHHRFAAADFAPLSLRCHTAITLLSLRYCCSCRRYAVATLSLRCRSAVAPLSLRCHSAVAPLLLSCCSAVAPLPLLLLRCRCCCSFCRYAVTAVIAPDVTPLSLLLSLFCHSGVALVLLRYHSVIIPPSLRCCSAADDVTPAVAPAIAPAVATLSLLISLLMSLHCHYCCRPGVAPLSFRYHSAVAPLLLRCR